MMMMTNHMDFDQLYFVYKLYDDDDSVDKQNIAKKMK